MRKIIGFILLLGLIFACEKSVLLEEVSSNAEPTFKSAPTDIIVPDHFATIQEAVNEAADGTTIIIKEGVYPELIFIQNKNDLTLIGQDALICPPDGITYGEGSFNVEILACSNIKILNLKFDGKIEETTEYPIDRAIVFNGSSGEISHNKITGYGLGIACDKQYPAPLPIPVMPDPGAMMNIKISKNNFSDCYGQIGVTGNYNYQVDQNIISYSFDQSRLCDKWFPHWFGIEIEGGTGIITKNKIKLKERSEFLYYSVGVRLMKRDPADHIQGYMVDLHDVQVTQNIIHGTDVGISVNSYDPLPDPEVWCVQGVSLLYNKFIKVGLLYEINNECEDIEIKP